MAYGQQTQALIDQLGDPRRRQTTPTLPGGQPIQTATRPTFAGGGTVTELPTGGQGEAIGNIAAGVGGQVAGKVLSTAGQSAARQGVNSVAQQVGGSAAKQAASKLTSFGGGAAGAAASAGIGLATGLIADKLRVKEEQPTFGGANADYLDQYGRRFEGTGGGLASNAVRYAGYGSAAGPIGMGVGALAGLIKGAATKNAPSAYTDFRVEDASQAIKDIYAKELGREASDEEVMGHLKNVGFDPAGGDRWAGEKSTNFILDQIRASPEAEAFRTGGAGAAGAPSSAGAAVADPLGAGGADPFATGKATTGARPTTAKDALTQAGVTDEPTAAADLSGRAGQGIMGPPMIDTDGDGIKDALDPRPQIVEAEAGAGAPAAAPAQDTSAWNTDGYSAPAYTPPQAGATPPGWDQTKWNDPNHQTPKYGVGRILSNFPPTVEGLTAAFPDIEKAYPGATFNGKDKITIPGVGEVDVLQGASQGGVAWRWGADDGAAGAGDAGASAAPQNALTDASGGPSNQGDVAALIQSLIGGQGATDQQSLTKLLLNQVRG